MSKVAYAGPEQHTGYALSKADFATAGVEHEDTFFPLNKAVEVPDEVADILTSRENNPFVEIPFVRVDDEVIAKDADGEEVLIDEGDLSKKAKNRSRREAAKAAKASDASGAPTEGPEVTTQGTSDVAGDTGPSSTGAGTSTSGSPA